MDTTHKLSETSRGWGPFTGRQLTTIVCVAIVAIVVMVPTAALAASGVFSSTSAPAVTATNSSKSSGARAIDATETNTGTSTRYGVHGSALGAGGIGVGGAGAKYGVYSYGDLGIRSGNKLACSACVTKSALSADLKPIKIDFTVPFGTTTAAKPIGTGLTLIAYCQSNQTYLEFNTAPATNTLSMGGIQFTGTTSSVRDVASASGAGITQANPTGPLHYSGTIQNVGVGGIYQLDLHMSPADPCRVWGSSTLVG
jgi:hypothetical protein